MRIIIVISGASGTRIKVQHSGEVDSAGTMFYTFLGGNNSGYAGSFEIEHGGNGIGLVGFSNNAFGASPSITLSNGGKLFGGGSGTVSLSGAAITLNNGGDGNYYATFVAPFDVILSGNTAYTATLNADNTRVSFTELGVGVPAGTAVLLKGTEASITASIEDASVTFDGDNALVGNYFSKTLEENTQFALGISEGVVGFYPYTDALGANKAYLEATGSESRAFVINFDDVTGISSVEAAKANGQAIYDLQGRRVQNAQKGIYIIGGRKVLVK